MIGLKKPATAMSELLAQALMEEFAIATGVTGEHPPRRYLWTDAFAVCNFLALKQATGEVRYLDLAADLVLQVHHILGRHRPDDPRTGWISGLPEGEGEEHPTRGGLRIGKPLNERGRNELADPRLEWEQDGQYFHYLTKWIHALCRMGHETGEQHYWRWAAELAVTAQRAFTRPSGGASKRLVWKMSIDLSRSLVTSTGQHDALDGLVTCLELRSEAPTNGHDETDLGLTISELSDMCTDGRWDTDDALGIGGLLDDATRLAKLVFQRHLSQRQLLQRILIAAARSLQAFDESSLSRPATRRLAFREFGLAIGLSGIEHLGGLLTRDREFSAVTNFIVNYRAWGEHIREFWSHPEHRNNEIWRDHHDINSVMLATCLLPVTCPSL